MANFRFIDDGNMGIGELLKDGTYLKRKYRWTFAAQLKCNNYQIPYHFVKSASRPNIEVEELEINFLNQKAWIPGKAAWQTIEVTYYDIAVKEAALGPLWTWIDSVYEIIPEAEGQRTKKRQASRLKDYGADCYLALYDGCGTWVEAWTLYEAWPQSINWGELDYSSNDEANIVVTLRYNDVTYKPNPACSGNIPKGCCTPCGT